jgi:7-keto-8-aminopelargonate synthetase-like enzyme
MASTPLPLPLANASLESLRLLKTDGRFKKRLQHNTAWVKAELARASFPLPIDAPGPIIPVLPISPRWTANLKNSLLKAGIHPPLIKYPNGPKQGYFRFVVSSEHTSKQLRALVKVLTTYNTASSAG